MATLKPYHTWNVGSLEFKLKLTSKNTVAAEEELGTNILVPIMKTGDNYLPPLSFMITVIHYAAQKYHHGISKDDIYDAYDEYIEAGGTETDLLTDVILPIYKVSGFFKQAPEETTEPTKQVKKPAKATKE